MNPAFSKEYPEFAGKLEISLTNLATVKSDDMEATVQLLDDEEAQKMIAEFEDPEGELMYEEGAIFSKYEQLKDFRP